MGIQVDLLAKNKTLQDYINFEFDGKQVSDFGLVVVSDGDRLNFAGSSDFEDEVQSINGVNGQYYWGTNFKSLKRDFTLATDGMTEAQLQAFKYHFRPGHYGKFVEAHLPYRESYCRIAAVTNFSMVPFRKLTNVAHKGSTHSNLYVNEYKGEVKLTLEWDNPYTTSTHQYFTKEYQEEHGFDSIYDGVFTNNIPLDTSLASTFLPSSNSVLGLGILGKMILGSEDGICDFHLGTDKKLRCEQVNSEWTSSLVNEWDEDGNLVPDEGAKCIPGLKVFYNPSTAPTSSKITFYITPTVNTSDISVAEQPVYFMDIADKYNLSKQKSNNNFTPRPYNVIQMSKQKIAAAGHKFVEEEGKDIKKEFLYSSPNVISSIHKAIDIGWKYCNKKEKAAVLMEEELRQEISHDKVLDWAIAALTLVTDKDHNFTTNTFTIPPENLEPLGYDKSSSVTVNWGKYFNFLMLLFFSKKEDGNITLVSSKTKSGSTVSAWESLSQIKICFDGETSSTYITYNCNTIVNAQGARSYQAVIDEPSGDMIYSGYLKLDGGDFIDESAQISACHYLKFLRAGGEIVSNIDNISLEYKFTYL